MTIPTEDELRHWRWVAEKATPGPWRISSDGWIDHEARHCYSAKFAEENPEGVRGWCALHYPDEKDPETGWWRNTEDATHIATFNPLTITRLIDAVETLKKENERLKAEIEEWQLAIKATAPK